jgi:hypothetical protein
MSANDSKLSAAIDRLTAAVRKQTEAATAAGKITKAVEEQLRLLREEFDSREFEASSSVAQLLSGLGNLATSAGLRILTDEPSASPPRRKKRRAA